MGHLVDPVPLKCPAVGVDYGAHSVRALPMELAGVTSAISQSLLWIPILFMVI